MSKIPPPVSRDNKPGTGATPSPTNPPPINRASKSLLPQILPPVVDRLSKPKEVETVFFHTIVSRHNSFFDGLGIFSKIVQEKDKRNINATIAQVSPNVAAAAKSPRVNAYVHTRFPDYPTIVFDDDIFMMAFWPGNIDSFLYKFSDKPTLDYPERVVDMGTWQGEVAEERGIHPYRYKFSQRSAIEKNSEIYARILSKEEERPTGYSNGAVPIIDKRQKFQSREYTHVHGGSDKREIPENELRHNECHIRASVSNIKSIALVKDYDLENISDLIELLQINSLRNRVIEKKREALEDKAAFAQEMKFVENKSANLEKVIIYLKDTLALYQTDLDNVRKGDYKFHKDLTNALKRKQKKYPDLEDSPEFREDWLTINIKKVEKEKQYLEEELEKNRRLDEDRIREKLQKEVLLMHYDKSTSTLVVANENQYRQEYIFARVMEIFNATKPTNALYQFVLGQAEPNAYYELPSKY